MNTSPCPRPVNPQVLTDGAPHGAGYAGDTRNVDHASAVEAVEHRMTRIGISSNPATE